MLPILCLTNRKEGSNVSSHYDFISKTHFKPFRKRDKLNFVFISKAFQFSDKVKKDKKPR